jgi:plasmid maintenance system killer protein
MRYTIKKNNDKYELWIRINNQYSQVFTFETQQDAEIAKREAIAADAERLAEIVTIHDYFKVEAK